MDGSAKIEGLEDAMRTLQAAFPNDFKKQARMINGAMGGSARQSILPIAKQLAKRGDSSGALSEALGVRAQKARKRYGKAGGMEVVPVRYNPKAIAMYLKHYFLDKGIAPPLGGVDGIRHGHLVEFGTAAGKRHAATRAFPFLWPAAMSGSTAYRNKFARELKKRIESAVKREAKKKAGKK